MNPSPQIKLNYTSSHLFNLCVSEYEQITDLMQTSVIHTSLFICAYLSCCESLVKETVHPL